MGDVDVVLHMDAPPAAVWSLVSDPTRMGEWSPECVSGQWLGGATAAVPGARFRGSNRLGWRRWSTTCTVSTVDLERCIAWEVTSLGLPVATWTYLLEPDGSGTRVTETFVDRRGGFITYAGMLVRGVRDAPAHNRTMMGRTLEAMRVAAEAP